MIRRTLYNIERFGEDGNSFLLHYLLLQLVLHYVSQTNTTPPCITIVPSDHSDGTALDMLTLLWAS